MEQRPQLPVALTAPASDQLLHTQGRTLGHAGCIHTRASHSQKAGLQLPATPRTDHGVGRTCGHNRSAEMDRLTEKDRPTETDPGRWTDPRRRTDRREGRTAEMDGPSGRYGPRAVAVSHAAWQGPCGAVGSTGSAVRNVRFISIKPSPRKETPKAGSVHRGSRCQQGRGLCQHAGSAPRGQDEAVQS